MRLSSRGQLCPSQNPPWQEGLGGTRAPLLIPSALRLPGGVEVEFTGVRAPCFPAALGPVSPGASLPLALCLLPPPGKPWSALPAPARLPPAAIASTRPPIGERMFSGSCSANYRLPRRGTAPRLGIPRQELLSGARLQITAVVMLVRNAGC